MYSERGTITQNDIENALIQVIISTLIFVFGFIIITKPFDRVKSYIPSQPTDFMIRHKHPIIILITILVVLKCVLIFVLDIGMKGEKVTSPIAFLARLIPVDLIYGVVVLYLFKYTKYINRLFKILLTLLIIAFSMSILATGSKSFFMVLAFGYGTFLMYKDQRIPFGRAGLLLGLGSAAIVLSFVAATAVKVANTLGKDTGYILQVGFELASDLDYVDIFDDVTSRFIGLDGSLVTEKIMPWKSTNLDKLRESFSISEVLKRSVSMTIPGVKAGSTLGSGVAIGRYINGLPAAEAFAGAIGSIGSFQLMMPPGLDWLAKLIFGFIVGGYVALMRKFQNADLQYILLFFLSYFVLFSIMSGNYDLLISLMIIKVSLTLVYYVMVLVLAAISDVLFEPKFIKGITFSK